MNLVKKFDNYFYPNHHNSWDNTLFREYVLTHIRPEFTMLDLGAGAGILPQMNFRGSVDKMCGLDPNPRVIDNPYLDKAEIGFGENIPWPDSTFDIVISANVLEHLSDPRSVFKEISRVLKPGGLFLYKTPNRRHYMVLVARITPFWFHAFYNRLRGRAEEDTFPTLYRANRPEDILRETVGLNIRPDEVKLIEGRPEYLRLTAFTYLFGIVYERLVNSSELFKNYRIILIGKMQRTEP